MRSLGIPTSCPFFVLLLPPGGMSLRSAPRVNECQYEAIKLGMPYTLVRQVMGRPPDARGPLPCQASLGFYTYRYLFWVERFRTKLVLDTPDPLPDANQLVMGDRVAQGRVIAIAIGSEGLVRAKV